MSSPTVSLIIPAHNGAAFYASALDSVTLQHWPELEVVVVDDGSTDNLSQIVRNSTVAVRYLRQPQQGPAAARNAGLRVASAERIAFLDIDDIWAPEHLSTLCRALDQDHEAGFAHGLVRQFVILPDGRRMLSGAYRMPYLGSCLFRRNVLEECGAFDEKMQMGEDYDLMFRCWERDIPKRNVDHVSLFYRRHEGNMTRGKNQAANLAVLQRRMQRIRRGTIDPTELRRFDFEQYIGDIRSFGETEVEMPGQWTLSSAL